MHAAENNHVRVRLRRLLREAERIAHEIRHVLNLRHLIVMREDDGVRNCFLSVKISFAERLNLLLGIAARGFISATSIMLKSLSPFAVSVNKGKFGDAIT